MKKMLSPLLVLLVFGCLVSACTDEEASFQQIETAQKKAAERTPLGELPICAADEGRIDPWQRLETLDRTYRDTNVVIGPQIPWAVEQEQFEVGWMYVLVGRDFAASGDFGGATQAYWAALRITPEGASRPILSQDRDGCKVREYAYMGLDEVAILKHQRQWAEMLSACSTLAGLSSDARQKAMTEQMEKEQRAKEQVDAQTQAARRATFTQGLGVGLEALEIGAGAVSGAAAGGGAAGAVSAVAANPERVSDVVVGAVSVHDEVKRTNEAYDAAMSEINRAAADSPVKQSDQDTAIEGGKSFFAEEVIFHLIEANDQQLGLQESDRNTLEVFAADKPEIRDGLSRYWAAETDSEKQERLTALAEQLRNYELFVARYERRGKSPATDEPSRRRSSNDRLAQ